MRISVIPTLSHCLNDSRLVVVVFHHDNFLTRFLLRCTEMFFTTMSKAHPFSHNVPQRGAHQPNLLGSMRLVLHNAFIFVKQLLMMAVFLRNNYSIYNPKQARNPSIGHLLFLGNPQAQGKRQLRTRLPASVRQVFVKRLYCALIRSCSYSFGITARKDMIQCTAKDLIGFEWAEFVSVCGWESLGVSCRFADDRCG